MKRLLAAVLGMYALSVATADALPLGAERPPVRLGALKPVTDVVLYNKIVVTADGRYFGWVENVEYVGSFVTQVKVCFDNYKRAAWIFVEHVKYDPINNVVVTDLSPERIQRVLVYRPIARQMRAPNARISFWRWRRCKVASPMPA